MRATYESDGEENKEANASVKAADPAGKPTPGGMGAEAKGASTDARTFADKGKSTPSTYGDGPKGVQTFNDMNT